MNNENSIGYIPRTLDKLERFLIWEIDQALIALIFIGMGAAAGLLFVGIVSGGAIAWSYGKIRAGKHAKFALHFMYWWFPSDMLMKTHVTPPSHLRYFLG